MNADAYSLNNPFFIAGAAMFTFGVVLFVLARIHIRAVREAAASNLQISFDLGFEQGVAKTLQRIAKHGKRAEPQQGGKEQGHD